MVRCNLETCIETNDDPSKIILDSRGELEYSYYTQVIKCTRNLSGIKPFIYSYWTRRVLSESATSQ